MSEIQTISINNSIDTKLSISSSEALLTELARQAQNQSQNSNIIEELVKEYTNSLTNALQNSDATNMKNTETIISKENQINQSNETSINKENCKNYQTKSQETKSIHSLIKVSNIKERPIQKIFFGQCLPGYVLEESLILENISTNHSIVCEVRAQCLDEILDQLSEYVYSVRKKDNYSYNENQIFKIQPGKKVQVVLALKTPNIKKEQIIPGNVLIKLAGIKEAMKIKMNSDVKIPKLTCSKLLYSKKYDMPVIKLAMKLLTKAECKIPFKNLSTFNIKAEFELIKDQENKFGKGIEFRITPEQGILQAGQIAMIVLNARKVGFNYEMLRNDTSITVNLMLVAKIQNSSVMICFPLMVEIY